MRDCFYCKYCNLREKSIFINFARNKNLKNGGNCVCEIFQPLKVPKLHPWIERFFQISNLMIGKVGSDKSRLFSCAFSDLLTFRVLFLCRKRVPHQNFSFQNVAQLVGSEEPLFNGHLNQLVWYDAIASLDFSFHTSDHVPHTKQVHTQPLLNPSPVKHQKTIKFT